MTESNLPHHIILKKRNNTVMITESEITRNDFLLLEINGVVSRYRFNEIKHDGNAYRLSFFDEDNQTLEVECSYSVDKDNAKLLNVSDKVTLIRNLGNYESIKNAHIVASALSLTPSIA